jgi:predicted PurR-regulated permease PerM
VGRMCELSGTQTAAEGDGTPRTPAPRVHPTVSVLAAYCWRLLVIAAVVVGVIWLLGELKVVFVPVLIATLLARVLEPVAAKLRARGWRPGLAAGATFVSFLGAVALVISLILPAVIDQFEGLGPTLSEAVEDVETWLIEDGPVDVTREDIDRATEQLGERLSDLLSSPPGELTSAAGLLVEIPTGGLLAAFLTFFMIKDGERFTAWVQRLVPARHRPLTTDVGRRAWTALGGFLRGAALLGTIESIIIGLAVFLVGGELVAPIMVLTFAAAFIPILGAITAGVVAVLVTLVTAGAVPALIIAVVAIVVQQLDNDLLAPVIYGRMLQIHPSLILVGVVAGGALFGLLGTLFAVPVIVVALGVGDEARRHLGREEGADPPREEPDAPQ